MQCNVSLSHSSLERGCISVALLGQKLKNDSEFLLGMWALLTEFSNKYFDTLKFEI